MRSGKGGESGFHPVRDAGGDGERGWRLIRSGELDGAVNMAVDEALLRQQQRTRLPPVLRFYGWDRPTISLGYLQKIKAEEVSRWQTDGIDLVRRMTGGWAVHHHRELTYAVAGRPGEYTLPERVGECFVYISRGIIRGLELLGVKAALRGDGAGAGGSAPEFFCFHDRARYDVVAGGKKLVGSAQRWQNGAFLQQGSIMLGSGPGLEDGTCLEFVLGRKVGRDEAAECLARGFSEALGIRLKPGEMLPEERELAERLAKEKYGGKEWTLTGKFYESSSVPA